MEEWRCRFRDATWCIVVLLSLIGVIYFYLQRGIAHNAMLSDALKLPAESMIPFLPWFVWIYITLWLAMPLPFYIYTLPRHLDSTERALRFTRKKIGLPGRFVWRGLVLLGKIQDLVEFIFGCEPDKAVVKKVRRQIIISYFIVTVVSAALYYFFPMKTERPQFDPVGLTLWVLNGVYRLDAPNSLFPSLHATFAFLIFFIFNFLRPKPEFANFKFNFRKKEYHLPVSRVGAWLGIWAILVVLSTYFVKQHIVIDGIAGFFLAYAAYEIGFSERVWRFLSRFFPTIFPTPKADPDPASNISI